jgi:hypothetical protein
VLEEGQLVDVQKTFLLGPGWSQSISSVTAIVVADPLSPFSSSRGP